MKDINSVYDPSIDADVPMRCKTLNYDPPKGAGSRLRRDRAKAYIEIILRCELNLAECVHNERKADMAMRLLIHEESAIDIGELYGVTPQMVYEHVYGRKNSVYSTLRSYISRTIKE